MYQTYTRSLSVPSFIESIPWVSVDNPADVHYDTEYRAKLVTLFSKVSPPVRGPKTLWKPFEHYTREIILPTEKQHVTWTGQSWYDDPIRTAHLTDPLTYSDIFSTGEFTTYPITQDDLCGYFTAGLSQLYVDTQDSTGFIPLPSNVDELVRMSIYHMRPTVRAELSLLNSLYELKDFKTLPRSLSKWKTLFEALSKGVSKGTLRQAVAALSDAYLQKEFNIEPLLSDLSSIYSILKRLKRRYDALESASGKLTTRHYMYKWREFNDAPLWQTQDAHMSFFSRSAERGVREVLCSDSEFRAHMQFTYKFTAFQEEHKRLLQLLDQLGVNFNPAVVWNAVPWTFVVDWVLGVSRWLDSYKVALAEPAIYIQQFCYSIKRSREVRVSSIYETEAIPGKVDGSVQILRRPTVRETAYRRVVTMPDASSFTTSGLSLKEASLAGALVFSKTPRHKRRRRRSPLSLL